MIKWLYFRYEVKKIEQELVKNSDLLSDIAGYV
jgi:hypothetical protein